LSPDTTIKVVVPEAGGPLQNAHGLIISGRYPAVGNPKLEGGLKTPSKYYFFCRKNYKKSLARVPHSADRGASVRKINLLLTIVCGCALAVSANAARTESLSFTPQTVFQKRTDKEASEPSKSEFVFKDRTGKTVSAPIVEQYQKNRIVHPMAKTDPRLDPKLSRAATIADERAHAHSKSRCWHYVKEALVASGAVSSYPKTSLAKEAGEELVRDYGFKKLPIRDPYAAPIGSVLVYFKGRNNAGHVEIRTKTGFVSDFRSKDACRYALVGVYAKR
jgi:hypothetical protein